MKTQKILKPGQAGTKKWVEKYGDALICIRYKLDLKKNRRVKTAEIILEEKEISIRRGIIPVNKLMSLKVSYNDIYLRKLVKSAGGKWNPESRVWELPYGKIAELGLKEKMIKKL